MEREAYLIEQIESYIDQLDLLGMQETLDQTRIDGVIETVVGLAKEYALVLDQKTEEGIQNVESNFVVTLDEELQKRQDILSVVEDKLASFSGLFESLEEMPYAKKLADEIKPMIEVYQAEVKMYEDDVALVNDQIKAVAEAEQLEKTLQFEKRDAYVQANTLRNAQISYSTLDEEIMVTYADILTSSNATSIDFKAVKEKQEVLLKRQAQLLENLELARSAKDAEGYVVTYEARVKKNRIELDKIEEQKFLYFLGKLMKTPVTSYETLEKRTQSIQALIQSRTKQVAQLAAEKVINPEEYTTVASQIDHTRIFTQLQDLETIKKNDEIAATIEERLKTTRDHIKGKEELEQTFAEFAKGRGRTAIVPTEPVKLAPSEGEAEILFGDEDGFDGYESLSDEEVRRDKKRRQIIKIEPAKQTLLNKLGNIKKFLLSKLEKLRSIPGMIKEKIEELTAEPLEYTPSIGDQIQLLEGAMIYANPMYAVDSKDGVEAKQAGVADTNLFITRGAILDDTGTPIYITSEHGVDLEAVASNMNLQPGSYQIALGCSSGDMEGKFVAVTDEELNPEIEKGWIRLAEPKLLIVNQLNKNATKGGMSK